MKSKLLSYYRNSLTIFTILFLFQKISAQCVKDSIPRQQGYYAFHYSYGMDVVAFEHNQGESPRIYLTDTENWEPIWDCLETTSTGLNGVLFLCNNCYWWHEPQGNERHVSYLKRVSIPIGSNMTAAEALEIANESLSNDGCNEGDYGGFCEGQGGGDCLSRSDYNPLMFEDMTLKKVIYSPGDLTYEVIYEEENSECCDISSISMQPTDYLSKSDPETGGTVKEVWNADDPIDFLQAFEIKDQDGNLLSSSDQSKIKWYVEDRTKLDDIFIYVDPDAPYNTPTEYYFNSVPNIDQWGEVLIRAEYECADGTIVHTVAELDVLDIGIYFRDPSGDILRWHKNLYEKDASIYDGFYNPSKNIVLHSHGWQPGANARHELNPAGNPERGKLDGSGILDWYSDYNVLLFFWTQSAEHLNGEILNTVERPSERIVYNNPAWVREDGTESRAGISTDPVGVMCGKKLQEIINSSGFNNATKEVRLAGHSLGSIMVTRAALYLGNSVVDRVAYLDPAMTVTFMNLYNDQISANPSVMPPIEWYQTSPYDYFSWHPLNWLLMQAIDKDTYNEMILNSTYVRTHPLWQNSYAEWDTLIGRCLLDPGNCKDEVLESLKRSYPIGDGALHGNAKQHYYGSLKETKPLVVESVDADLAVISILNCPDGSIGAENREDILFHAPPFYSNPLYTKCFLNTGVSDGPSAAASIEDLSKYRGIPLEQVYGVTTVTTADDRYTPRATDVNGQLYGQEYSTIDLAIEPQINANQVVLNWEQPSATNLASTSSLAKSSNAGYYAIYNNETYETIGYTTDNTFTVDNLTIDTDYEFGIVSFGADGYPNGYDTISVRTMQPKKWEIRKLSTDQTNNKQWHSVEFGKPMNNPSVILGPLSFNGGNPTTLRVKNITNTGFQYQLDEWDYLDGAHVTETLSMIAVSEGVTNIGNIAVESGKINNVNHEFKHINFENEFSEKPIVFAQTTSFNGGSAVVTRLKNVTTTGFDIRLQEEENNDGFHANETVSYIAFVQGTHNFSNGNQLSIAMDSFDHNFKSIAFNTVSNPRFIATTQTMRGGDPVGMRYKNLTDNAVQVKLEEETSFDTEVNHVTEDVGYLIFGKEETSSSVTSGIRSSSKIQTLNTTNIFPNPTANKLFVSNVDYKITRLTVLDFNGRILLTYDMLSKEAEIDVSGFKSGMYVLKILTDQNIEKNFTFIKSHE